MLWEQKRGIETESFTLQRNFNNFYVIMAEEKGNFSETIASLEMQINRGREI